MSKKLIKIQKEILHRVTEGTHVDKVADELVSDLSLNEKIELKILFEDAMRKYRLNAESWLHTNLTFPLSEILKSRLFVYPEPDETEQQAILKRKLKNKNYSWSDFEDHLKNHIKSPLTLKVEQWEELEDQGGLYAWIYNDYEKRNKAIYDLADRVARKNQCNIDLGIYISDLDKHIIKYTSEIDILSGLHLRYSIPQKNILVWDTLTSAENLGGTSSDTFGKYKVSCKFQWEILNRTPEPEVGYVQIEENDDDKNFGDSFSPIFVEVIEDVNDLDNKLDLLYNKLNDIRQTNDRVTD